VPLKEFSLRYLRARRGTSGGVRGVRGRGWRGAGGVEGTGGVGAVCQPHTLAPSCPLAPASPRRRGQGGGRSAAGSHVIQRGEGAELRGQAAAQAVLVKDPASEKGHQRRVRGVSGRGWRGAGGVAGHGRCGGCVPGPRALARSPPRPCLPTAPRAGRRPSAAGSHPRQRGEGAELRGQAAAQAVLVKPPASEKGHQRGVRGVRGRGWRGAGGVGGMGGVRAWEVCGGVPWAGGGVSQVVGAVVGRQGRRDHERG